MVSELGELPLQLAGLPAGDDGGGGAGERPGLPIGWQVLGIGINRISTRAVF